MKRNIPATASWSCALGPAPEPWLSHGQAGLLLGISDHAAFKLARSAIEKLTEIGLSQSGGTNGVAGTMTEGAAHVPQDQPIWATEGWLRITDARYFVEPRYECLDWVLSYAFLRPKIPRRLRPRAVDIRPCGQRRKSNEIIAVARFGKDAFYRPKMKISLSGTSSSPEPSSIALLDVVEGEDDGNTYCVPLLRAILVLEQQDGSALVRGRSS